jgi:hypothetical protein
MTAVLLILAGALLVTWARDPRQWAAALDYRFWVVEASAVPMLLALLAVAFGHQHGMGCNGRIVTLGSAICFGVVMVVQARVWATASDRVLLALSHLPPGCSAMVDLTDVGGTAFEHWATIPYVLDLQTRSPARYVLRSTEACEQFVTTGDFALADWDIRPAAGGWFRFTRASTKGG